MKKLLFLLIFLFQFCSYENPYTARIKYDYITIDQIGNFWIYKNQEGNEKYVEVKENTTNLEKDFREVIILEENYIETYWYKGEGFLSRYRDIEINFNGNLYQVEHRWQNYIEIPLVKGNSWIDEWTDTLLFFNEPLYRTDNLQGYIECFETIEIEAGKFKNCYRIKFHVFEKIISTVIGDSISEKTYWEWYAPDIGLIKSTYDNETWELINYGKKEEGE
ncbi:hypothetical protein KAX75_10170 [candidate division WOR-3 bacterium]|nr:hypothetical protein [candidate division WOR-3 bacterium]